MVEEPALRNKPSPDVDEVREFDPECGWSRLLCPASRDQALRAVAITGSRQHSWRRAACLRTT